MTKPVLTLRNVKNLALTYDELDTNFTNLRDSTINFTGDAGDTRSMDLNDTTDFEGQRNMVVTVDEATQKIYIKNNLSEYAFDPIGFENIVDATVSFNDSTRVFTIAPASTSYRYWWKGKQITVSTSKTVTIPNTSGNYLIYFDDETLSYALGAEPNWATQVPVSYIAWNATIGQSMFSKELHTISMDWKTKEYLHETQGAQYAEGLTISNYTTTGTGSSDADAQLDIADGVIYDQDIAVEITHSNTPTANTWQQDLQGPARIPVVYHTGSNGSWTRDALRDFPVKNGTSLVTYNLNTAGTWTTPDITSTHYVAYWIVATNFVTNPIISIMGQRSDNKLTDAVTNNTWTSLDLSNFPAQEFRPLYRVIFRSASTYTNTPKAYIAQVDDFRFSTIIPQGGISAGATNAITDGNSSVTVSDTGSGTVVTNVDGADIVTVNGSGLSTGLYQLSAKKVYTPFLSFQSDTGGNATIPGSGASYTIDLTGLGAPSGGMSGQRQVIWDLKNLNSTCSVTIALPVSDFWPIDLAFVNNSGTDKTIALNFSEASGYAFRALFDDNSLVTGSASKNFYLTANTVKPHITWFRISKVIDSSLYANPYYNVAVMVQIMANDALYA